MKHVSRLILASVFPLTSLLAIAPVSFADDHAPTCVNGDATDPDGDGWGFENGMSCLTDPVLSSRGGSYTARFRGEEHEFNYATLLVEDRKAFYLSGSADFLFQYESIYIELTDPSGESVETMNISGWWNNNSRALCLEPGEYKLTFKHDPAYFPANYEFTSVSVGYECQNTPYIQRPEFESE